MCSGSAVAPPLPPGVVNIDDHPGVTTLEDPQSNTTDDGFTEVVSRKQQKRLQDEERRKKEEQTTQVRKGRKREGGEGEDRERERLPQRPLGPNSWLFVDRTGGRKAADTEGEGEGENCLRD